MKNTVLCVIMLLFAAAILYTEEKPELNPLLSDQKPGTWLKLPNKGDAAPRRIHGHCGIVIDPATSILYFFGSDTHNQDWNNDVWSYDPAKTAWTQHYKPDPRSTYQYKDGYRSTTTGRPWCMHTFSLNAWDPVEKRMVVSARPVHYGLNKLPQVTMPKKAADCWWDYDPKENKWYPIKNGPYLNIGEICYIPTIKQFIGFNSGCAPITFYDPEKKSFEILKGWKGTLPKGYTRKAVYDSKRDRILLISVDNRLWSFAYKEKKWTEVETKNKPETGLYGSWDYDASADILVSLRPDDPKGTFGNRSGKSRTVLFNFDTNEWKEHTCEPAAPYRGMSFKMAYDERHKITLYVDGNTIWSFKAPVNK